MRIRPLALCVFRREDGSILVAPGDDHVKNQRFYRPLGGGIEFGERAEDAARREIREELGAEVDGLRFLGAVENLFTFLGEPGHELIWLYEGRFADPALYARDRLEGREGGEPFAVEWVPLSHFVEGRWPLYPDGLLELLTDGRSQPALRPYLNAILQVPSALQQSYHALLSQGPLDISGTQVTAAILLTLGAHFNAERAVKKLLGKVYMGASADFFVETLLFYIKAFTISHQLPLEAYSERNLSRRRGSVRPDISIWRDSEPIAAIECKTNLGWNRSGWKEDFENREKRIKADFPAVDCSLVVLTAANWPGFRDYPRVGHSAFTLSRFWPSDVHEGNVEEAMLDPIEPLLRRLLQMG